MARQSGLSRSIRQKAFLLYDIGKRPSETAKILGIKDTHGYRYYQQWKRLPPMFYPKYREARKFWRKLSQADRSMFVRMLAFTISALEKEVEEYMRKPWSFRAIVSGEWKNWPVGQIKLGFTERLLLKAKLKMWLGSSQYGRLLVELALDKSIKRGEIDLDQVDSTGLSHRYSDTNRKDPTKKVNS